MNIYLVIPTIRTLSFLQEWGGQFSRCHLVLVEDRLNKEVKTPTKGFLSVTHVTWKNIHDDLGENEWIFSRQNAGIRSYGFLKAYQNGADVIVTLDDDCYPVGGGFIDGHVSNLSAKAPDRWCPTFPHPDYLYTRGFPYDVRHHSPVVISHGLWSNKMDMDAQTQLRIGPVNVAAYPPIRQFIPKGTYYAMSSMNLAFVRQVAPLMYFPLMGKDPALSPWGFDRFDDIWAGVFSKKIVDHLGYAVANGSPFVEHRKASDPNTNLMKEKSGIQMNELLWKLADETVLSETSPVSCFRELNDKIRYPKTEYFERLKAAIDLWLDLF